jgi:fatty-acyl-CoA synthase
MTQTRFDEPDMARKCSTVGRALPGVEVAVISPETGQIVPPDQPGELCCRGYLNMSGYYNLPAETAACIDPNGWLHSGDIGIMDAQGYYRVTGRLKDMIIRGGENIYPKEVEEFLHSMEGISDIQVVGVPSRTHGEEVAAFVVLKAGATLVEADIQDFCRGKIGRHKIPRFVAFVSSFPMTASGKIQKYKLREQAVELWPGAAKVEA